MAEIHTMHNTKAGRVFDVCNILFLGGVGAITILPFLYIIARFLCDRSGARPAELLYFPENLYT